MSRKSENEHYSIFRVTGREDLKEHRQVKTYILRIIFVMTHRSCIYQSS